MKPSIVQSRLVMIISITLIVIASACLTGYQLFMNKCFWWDCAPKRDFTVFDLNLPSDFFPNASEVPLLKPDRGNITAIEEAIGVRYWSGGGAVYIVNRFATENQAMQEFMSRSRREFFTSQLENVNVYRDILTYQSDVANTYNIKCGYDIGRTSCIFIARYQEYYIFFNGYLSESGLSKEKFLGVLGFIDSRMNELLYEN